MRFIKTANLRGDPNVKRTSAKYVAAIGFVAVMLTYFFISNKSQRPPDEQKWLSRIVDNGDGTRDFILVSTDRSDDQPKIWRLNFSNKLNITTKAMGEGPSRQLSVTNYDKNGRPIGSMASAPSEYGELTVRQFYWPGFEPISKEHRSRRMKNNDPTKPSMTIRFSGDNMFSKLDRKEVERSCEISALTHFGLHKLSNKQVDEEIIRAGRDPKKFGSCFPKGGRIERYSRFENLDNSMLHLDCYVSDSPSGGSCRATTTFKGWQVRFTLPYKRIFDINEYWNKILTSLKRQTISITPINAQLREKIK